VKDLGIRDGIAGIERTEGDFYYFSVSVKNEEGGDEVIAKRLPDGHFEMVWEGQDYPPCAPLSKYGVPSGIAPKCFEDDIVIDR
jgi:hypothetical protein